MARVTVEDCVTRIPNRFHLVMTAAQRARNIASGAELTIDRDNDKNPVVALREIAEESIDFVELKETLITSLQRYVEVEEPEEDEMSLESLHSAAAGGILTAVQVRDEEVLDEQGEATDADEVLADELTVHDVASEEVDAALAESEILHEGGEIPADAVEEAEAVEDMVADDVADADETTPSAGA